ncbi:hypothetical protein SESBI_51308 [Sesbania bispinosa]|nr:hypothetical protein SESBI_51308 [Sesbania bispinosa]
MESEHRCSEPLEPNLRREETSTKQEERISNSEGRKILHRIWQDGEKPGSPVFGSK